MSRRSSDSYEDLSFPEISTQLWSQLNRDEPTTNRGSPGQIEVDALETGEFFHVDRGIHDEERSIHKEESDSSLWEEFPDIQTEDLLEVEREELTVTPTLVSAETVASPPPLHLILGKLFDGAAGGDIEEGGMSICSAGNLIRKYKYNGSLSVTNLVQPLWYVFHRAAYSHFDVCDRCEHKTYYDLVGLERRGIDRRSKGFEVSRKILVDNKVMEKKVFIKVDQAAVRKGEAHKVRGQVSYL
jgi:hypothetical protein